MFDRSDDIFLPHGGFRTDVCDATTLAAIVESLDFAVQTNWESLRTPHLFMGLLSVADPCIVSWATRMNSNVELLVDQFRDLFYQDLVPVPPLRLHREYLSDNTIRTLRDSWARAKDYGRGSFGAMDLLITIITTPNSIVAECFERIGIPTIELTESAVLIEQEGSLSGN